MKNILSPGKTIEVEFDNPILVSLDEIIHQGAIIPERNKYKILEYIRPGRWMFKGVSSRDMEGVISMGEKRTRNLLIFYIFNKYKIVYKCHVLDVQHTHQQYVGIWDDLTNFLLIVMMKQKKQVAVINEYSCTSDILSPVPSAVNVYRFINGNNLTYYVVFANEGNTPQIVLYFENGIYKLPS